MRFDSGALRTIRTQQIRQPRPQNRRRPRAERHQLIESSARPCASGFGGLARKQTFLKSGREIENTVTNCHASTRHLSVAKNSEWQILNGKVSMRLIRRMHPTSSRGIVSFVKLRHSISRETG